MRIFKNKFIICSLLIIDLCIMGILSSGRFINVYEFHMNSNLNNSVANNTDYEKDEVINNPSFISYDDYYAAYHKSFHVSEVSGMNKYYVNTPIQNLYEIPQLTSSVSNNFTKELPRLNFSFENNGFDFISAGIEKEDNNHTLLNDGYPNENFSANSALNTDDNENGKESKEEHSENTEMNDAYDLASGDSDSLNENNDVESVSSNYNVQEHILEVIDGVTYIDGIMIVNKTYSLPEDYNPGGLLPEVKEAFTLMQSDAAKEGLKIYISSGYRSYKRQAYLHEKYSKRDGEEKADTYSARAGYSEHQTGLCIDLNSISDSFSDTPEAKWVADHAHEYGFIVRFPEGKEELTGYKYESWHLRYIGIEKATEVYQSGLCLEEFLGISSVYID